MKIDDAMDVFAEHAVAGMIGLLFNGLFATPNVIDLDGVSTGIAGGFVNHNYKQLYIQLAYVLACTGYSFVVSAILAYGINYIPGLKLRASEEAELLGMDDDQCGEFAYDYVEVRRDYLAWSPAQEEMQGEGATVAASRRHGIEEHSNMLEGKDPNAGSSDVGSAEAGVLSTTVENEKAHVA